MKNYYLIMPLLGMAFGDIKAIFWDKLNLPNFFQKERQCLSLLWLNLPSLELGQLKDIFQWTKFDCITVSGTVSKISA